MGKTEAATLCSPSSKSGSDWSQILLMFATLSGNNLNLECFNFTIKSKRLLWSGCLPLPHLLGVWHIPVYYPCNFHLCSIAPFFIEKLQFFHFWWGGGRSGKLETKYYLRTKGHQVPQLGNSVLSVGSTRHFLHRQIMHVSGSLSIKN